VYPYLVFLVFFQAPASQGTPLLESCSEPQHVLATLRPGDNVRVRASVAGEVQTCYGVTAVIDGRTIKGYILDKTIPAVADFERQRSAAPPVADAPPPAKVADPPVQPPHPRLPVFADFSATDLKGKPISLNGMKGKVILVCFWAPQSGPSTRELIQNYRLFDQFRRQGLDAVAISLSSNREDINDVLEEGIAIRTIPNDYDLGSRYGVSYEALPKTYILNDRHEILAAGLHGRELESTVRRLMKGE
jgi:AhpC/TSA family